MKRADGFTLIEVMVALAIFAIAITALMAAMNSSANNLSSLQDRTLAQWIASNRMVGFQSTRKFPKQKEEIEKINFGGTDKPREWIIRIQLQDTMAPDKNVKMLVISVGEEINKEKQYYASIETLVNISK